MIRLSKFADYGIVLLTYIASHSSGQPTQTLANVRSRGFRARVGRSAIQSPWQAALERPPGLTHQAYGHGIRPPLSAFQDQLVAHAPREPDPGDRVGGALGPLPVDAVVGEPGVVLLEHHPQLRPFIDVEANPRPRGPLAVPSDGTEDSAGDVGHRIDGDGIALAAARRWVPLPHDNGLNEDVGVVV